MAANRTISHEERLLAAATLAAGDLETKALDLRPLAAHALSPAAGPGWHLLRGAAAAFARAGRNHPARGELHTILTHAVRLARAEGLPDTWRPTYTGGARPLFEKDA